MYSGICSPIFSFSVVLNYLQGCVFLCSRNLLSVLPKYLFSLPLKVLLVSNNKLVSIPEEIGKAKDLMELVHRDLNKQFFSILLKEKHSLHFVSPLRMWAVMRSRCCRLRSGGFMPYGNLTSGRTVFTCCLRVSPSLRVYSRKQCLIINNTLWDTCSHL